MKLRAQPLLGFNYQNTVRWLGKWLAILPVALNRPPTHHGIIAFKMLKYF